MEQIKEYSYRVSFSFFDQILKSEKHFKNQMVFERIETKIKEIKQQEKDNYFIMDLRDSWEDKYKVLVKKVGESDIEIIQIDKSNSYYNLWGYSGCTFDSDKQKALLNEICHGNKYCYYNSFGREEPEEIKRLLQPSKRHIVEHTVLSVDDILEHSDDDNISAFHRFINNCCDCSNYDRRKYISEVSEESIRKLYIHDCYHRLKNAVKENTLLFEENGYEVHSVYTPYDIIVEYNDNNGKNTCNCKRLLNAYVIKDNKQNYAYYIK